MLTRLFQPALIWLGIFGFLIQSLCAGFPAGHSLCIGCEHGGWTICTPDSIEAPSKCCEGDDDPPKPSADHSTPVFQGKDECGCIDVPLATGLGVTISSPRVDPPDFRVFTLAVVLALEPTSLIVEPQCGGIWPRAGPPDPPRQLAPSSRCTVLVL